MTAQHLIHWNRTLLALLVVVLLPLAPPGSRALAQTNPNTFTVTSTADQVDLQPGDGFCDASVASAIACTLRAAIMEANALGGKQIINVMPGRYALTLAGTNEDASRTGDLDITGDVNIQAATSTNRPIIDANGLDRVFDIRSSQRLVVVLIGIVVRDGDATRAPFDRGGGGIRANAATDLFVRNSDITGNRADNAGGISILEGSLTISNSRITNNQASDGIAGINTAVDTQIRDSTISGNRGDFVGGIRLFAFSSAGRNSEVFINNSTISGNNGHIGGIEIERANVKLTNVTISGNSATTLSNNTSVPLIGGIDVGKTASVGLANVTIVQNSGAVGGLFSEGGLGASNTIIANNSGGDCNTARSINGFTNLSGDLTCRFLISVGNQRNVNPLLGPLALNGAANGTRTHALLSGSSALERGSNPCAFQDQRGIRRPQGANCDIGAFEQELRIGFGNAAAALPPSPITAQQTSTLALSWTVPPTMTWTDLNTIDLQLAAGDQQPLVIRFSQGVTATDELTAPEQGSISQAISTTDTLTLFDASGEVDTGAIGTAAVLESESAALDLAHSRLETDGPDGKTVTLTLAVRLKQPLAGERYAATLLATDDAGNVQGPELVGTLVVGPFTTVLPLVEKE